LALESHRLDEFDPKWAKGVKEEWIYAQVRRIVAEAKERNYAVVLEYLDFEGCKRWLRTKLGQMLRVMPYRKIRGAFERNCREHGVVLRYVRPHGTSVLGAVLSEHPNLGRDEAAGAVIGLRGYDEGNQWLERRCEELLSREDVRLRVNRKGKFGCTVSIDGALVPGQLDTGTGVHRFQNCAVRAIQSLSTAMAHFHYTEEWVPTRWKWARPPDSDKDAWHAVVPEGKAPPPNTSPCSTLSKAA
jgi:IS605 OrfB family transposase